MSAIDRVTFIIHTYDRPEFLIRLVRYFDSIDALLGVRVIIADGSDDDQAEPFDRWLAGHQPRFDLSLERHPRTTIMDRLGIILAMVDTPYVILGADDDLYFFDWIGSALEVLDAEPDVGVIFGDFMLFQLAAFEPYGRDVSFNIPKFENPPPAWLEDDTPVQRLNELASKRLGFATAGWYAIQRQDLLSTIVGFGQRFKLEPLMFERFLVLAQAAATKTRMLVRLLGARQVDPNCHRPPFQLRGNEAHVEALVTCCIAFLVEQSGFAESEARALTNGVLSAEVGMMELAYRKRHARALARSIPLLRTIWRRLRPVKTVHLVRDRRLPPSPNINNFLWQQLVVERVVRYSLEEAPAGA